MRKIAVVGNSGSGKSTLAKKISEHLKVEHLELDSVMHQADWTPLPSEKFCQRIQEFVLQNSGWVIDGNYDVVRDLIWTSADTVVWMDPPKISNMIAIVRRTMKRLIFREVLWNGNSESWSNVYRFDPEASVIVWAWQNHSRYRESYLCEMENPRWSQLTFVRLQSRRKSERWLSESFGSL